MSSRAIFICCVVALILLHPSEGGTPGRPRSKVETFALLDAGLLLILLCFALSVRAVGCRDTLTSYAPLQPSLVLNLFSTMRRAEFVPGNKHTFYSGVWIGKLNSCFVG